MHEKSDGISAHAPKFALGRTVITRNALGKLSQVDIDAGFTRHLIGDWGDLESVDIQANERSLLKGGRLVSVYHSSNRVKFYIITEADRSFTTVLLPEDY